MRGVFAQAGGGQSPRFILLIPQTFVELWPPYLDPLGGWFSPGPGLSPSCMHGGESWGKCSSFTWGLMVEKSRLKWDRELGERQREQLTFLRCFLGEARCELRGEDQVDLEEIC